MIDAIPIRIVPWSEARPDAMSVREAVFVVEQGVPPEIELDEQDAVSLHAVAFEGAKPIATGRLLPDGHIGRMAVLAEARGTGLGSAVLMALMDEARRRGYSEAILSAQTHAMPFYRRFGYAEEGAIYDDCGIPHITMRRQL